MFSRSVKEFIHLTCARTRFLRASLSISFGNNILFLKLQYKLIWRKAAKGLTVHYRDIGREEKVVNISRCGLICLEGKASEGIFTSTKSPTTRTILIKRKFKICSGLLHWNEREHSYLRIPKSPHLPASSFLNRAHFFQEHHVSRVLFPLHWFLSLKRI